MDLQALSLIQWAGVAGEAVAAVAALKFVVNYRRGGWRRSEAGRLVMLLAVTLSLLFLLAVGISVGIASNGVFADVLRGVRTALCFAFAALMTWQDRLRRREVRRDTADARRCEGPPTD